MTDQLLLGQTLRFSRDPFSGDPEAAAHISARGGVLVRDGRIAAVGEADDLRRDNPTATVTDHGDHLITAGFVDGHMHYPQTAMIASWGKRLIDWLNTYTFPEEMKFANRAYADEIAGRTLDLALANGTTTLTSFCTIHPGSVDAYFEAANARGMAVVGGKTCMDRNAPDGLRDTAKNGTRKESLKEMVAVAYGSTVEVRTRLRGLSIGRSDLARAIDVHDADEL
ncbi:MAG: amidohydrolase family protein, partial [Octadecabacter sp.]